MKDMEEKNRIKTKIRVGYVVKSKDGEKGDNLNMVRITSIRKEVMDSFQAVEGYRKFLVQFEDYQKMKRSDSSLLYIC